MDTADMQDTRLLLQHIAEALDDVFNPEPGDKQIGFILLVTKFDASEGTRTNYVSNSERAGALEMLKEVTTRFEKQAGAGNDG